jgi:hypothetical protein
MVEFVDLTSSEIRKMAAYISKLRSALEDAEEALTWQGKRWQMIAGGIDYEADPDNGSPENADAHLGGLAHQEIQIAIAKIREAL